MVNALIGTAGAVDPAFMDIRAQAGLWGQGAGADVDAADGAKAAR